ncbi:unnamed protein product [Blepharisma stoltei]|uniref:non-specific serine/threonine protein kinase n=1 Tax=Blepharisma stoltei TaxID=1481888 RepID=A0AAU9K0N1_9CILI|nr:unnamed protein product [Blepharisma stoltei]
MEEFDSGDYHDKFSSFYTYIRTIGKGSFGKVVKAIDKYTGITCAVKIIKKSSYSDEVLSALRFESEILSSLDHPNIVKFLHVRESDNRIFIGMEYIRGGNLSDLIQNKTISESKAAKIMTGIFRAVEYLHNRGIVHRDLKPANILISNPKDLTTVKVADFGLCTQLGIFSRTDEKCGTVIYMAPELAAGKNYNKEVDIWSCGIIMFKLLCKGKHPLYRQKDTKDSYFAKLQNPKWVFPKNFSPLAQNLFLKLMKIPPIERYTAGQVLAHPWILQKNIAIPLTYLEKMRQLDSDMKLRGFVYSLLFASLIYPSN